MRLVGNPKSLWGQNAADGGQTSPGREGNSPVEFPNPSHDLVVHVAFAALVNGFETLRSAVALIAVIRPPESHADFLVWFAILTRMGIAGILVCSYYFSSETAGGSHRFVRNMCLSGFLLHSLCPPIGVTPLLPDFGCYWYRWFLDLISSYAFPAAKAEVERQEWERSRQNPK